MIPVTDDDSDEEHVGLVILLAPTPMKTKIKIK